MLANKKSVLIGIPFVLITLFSFPHLWAQEELKKIPLDQQKSESKQKPVPSFTIKGAKIEVIPEKKDAKQQKGEAKLQQKQTTLQGHPKITFDSTSYNAGEVWEGDTVVHTFTVKNTGTAELTIAKVKPG